MVAPNRTYIMSEVCIMSDLAVPTLNNQTRRKSDLFKRSSNCSKANFDPLNLTQDTRVHCTWCLERELVNLHEHAIFQYFFLSLRISSHINSVRIWHHWCTISESENRTCQCLSITQVATFSLKISWYQKSFLLVYLVLIRDIRGQILPLELFFLYG